MDSELVRLQRRVEELEQRLAEVEGRLGIEKQSPEWEPVAHVFGGPIVEPSPPAAPPPPAPEAPRPPVMPPPIPQFAPAATAREEAPGLEVKAGLNWGMVIGAITMIFAVAFGFKAAIDNGLIPPAARVLCGLMAGAAALYGGDLLWRRDHKRYSQGIVALGVCIFYLSFYAAFGLYHLVPQTVAFVGAIVTTAAAGALALRYDSRIIAILALLGGYASPFLVSTGEPNDLFFGSYMAALNAIALTLTRRKGWLSVETVAAVCTLLLHGVWVAARHRELGPVMGGAFTVLQYGLFVHSRYAFLRLLAPVPAMGAIALLSPYAAPWFWLWSALVALVALALAWRLRDDRLIAASLAGWVAGVILWDPDEASHAVLFGGVTAAFLGYLAALLFVPATRRAVFSYSALALNAVFYYSYCYGWFDQDHHSYMGLLALAVAAVYLGAALYLKSQAESPKELLLVAAGIALAFVTLAIPIQLSGYSITLAWAVECAVLAYLAARFQSAWPFGASWLVGFLAIAVLLDSDANQAWGAAYSPIVNRRFIPFLVVAAALALNAWWTRQYRPRLAAVPFLAAHFILLVGLHSEVFAFLEHDRRPGEDLTGQEAVASTILLALYGFALVAHGITRNFRAHRMLGLLVFALVIGKLYLYDIWQLNWLYKMLAFGGLGAMLLIGSYLYSRHRHKLLELIQDKPAREEP